MFHLSSIPPLFVLTAIAFIPITNAKNTTPPPLKTQPILTKKASESKIEAESKHLSLLLLKSTPLSEEDQKKFAIHLTKYPGSIEKYLISIKLTADPAQATAAKKALKKLHTITKEKLRSQVLGASVGWHIYFKGEIIHTLPLIVHIKKNSLAEKAQLKAGDVIESCGPIVFSGDNTRNQFVILVNQWPQSIPLQLKIRRSRFGDNNLQADKTVTKNLTLFK